LDNTLVVPRPEQPLRLWLGTGGTPESVLRAAELGLPMFLGILGGTPQHWAQYGRAYREAWNRAGHSAEVASIAVAVHGFVGDDDHQAKAMYLDCETRMFQVGMSEIGRRGSPPKGREANYGPGGMVFAGGPNEVTERILHLHELLGHTRQILQMDVGGMPQGSFLRGIELLGTKVLPQIRKALGTGG
jgi:alkanesulfonate monooxygenase SsuD/methylene tetrahydromethanopterin reductase-like flavin-dependent oxidoreductase (luciferase family)